MRCPCGGTVDADDSKSSARKGMGVRVSLGAFLEPSNFHEKLFGATNGTRTRDIQDHNLALYQLSYGRHKRGSDRPGWPGTSTTGPMVARARRKVTCLPHAR